MTVETATIGALLEERPGDEGAELGLDDGPVSSSTRSAFVRARTPQLTPRSERIARCSRVCGITESSEATTRSATSIPGRPGDHRPHELLVPRDVDEREDRPAPLGVGEAEVDRDPARLLLGETVGVGPGQRLHEGALAVVDVSRGADEDAP